jgi:dolichol kinase
MRRIILRPGKAVKLSLLRRLFHFSGVVIPITYLLLGQSAALALTAATLVLLACADILRIITAFDSPFLRRHLKENELKKPTASLFYMISCLLVILLFDKPTAVASIFVLVVSDPLSALIGSRWGRRRFLGKSAEGTAAFFLSTILILTCFHFRIPALFAAAGAATAAELLSSRVIDDNFSIPVVTAFVLTLLGR